jgi:hypothetical protein
MSEGDNLSLYVAKCSDATEAKRDYQSLMGAQGNGLDVEGAVVMSSDATGDVDVLSKGVSDPTGAGA